jgi:hypothetical protein
MLSTITETTREIARWRESMADRANHLYHLYGPEYEPNRAGLVLIGLIIIGASVASCLL